MNGLKVYGFQPCLLLGTIGISMTLGSVAIAPAQAALLDFSFTTESGATGSFTLDTDTPPASEPSFGVGAEFEGILYPNAVSDFSLSTPTLNISGETTDYEVIPDLALPSPVSGEGVLSGVVFPSGCSATTDFTCLLTVGVVYDGEIPDLSDDPASYPRVLNIDIFGSETGEIERDFVTNSQVEVIPEPSSGLGVLAFGIGSWLWKRRRSPSHPSK